MNRLTPRQAGIYEMYNLYVFPISINQTQIMLRYSLNRNKGLHLNRYSNEAEKAITKCNGGDLWFALLRRIEFKSKS